MASSKLGARLVSLLALSWLGAGCYSTTPHRVQVESVAAPRRCSAAIVDVFERSGFVQLPTPRNWSMFFGPRLDGPYGAVLATGSGVGVTVQSDGADAGTCHVTLEALSPDVGCPGRDDAPAAVSSCRRVSMPADGPGRSAAVMTSTALCPIAPSMTCELSSAPGDDNDAVVDKLARQLRAVLSPAARVD